MLQQLKLIVLLLVAIFFLLMGRALNTIMQNILDKQYFQEYISQN
jgi:hypothetical protein